MVLVGTKQVGPVQKCVIQIMQREKQNCHYAEKKCAGTRRDKLTLEKVEQLMSEWGSNETTALCLRCITKVISPMFLKSHLFRGQELVMALQ